MGPGIRRLLRLTVASPVKAIERQLNPRTRLVLGANPDGSLAALLDDCADAAVAVLAPAPVWSSAEFAALRQRVADALTPTTLDIVARVEKVLAAAHEVEVALPASACRNPGRGDRRHPRTARPAAAARFRHRHRRNASRRPHPLPHRRRPTPRAVAPGRSTPTASGCRACTPCRTRTTNCGRLSRQCAPPPTMCATSRA